MIDYTHFFEIKYGSKVTSVVVDKKEDGTTELLGSVEINIIEDKEDLDIKLLLEEKDIDGWEYANNLIERFHKENHHNDWETYYKINN